MNWRDLNPSEQCEKVARAIGWRHEPRFPGDVSGYWVRPDGHRYITEDLPDFISSFDDFSLVEDEIERRGDVCRIRYIRALLNITNAALAQITSLTPSGPDVWPLIRATPDQRCQAALRALEES